MKNFIAILSVISILSFSCNTEETQFLTYEEQLKIDTKVIDDYLSSNGLTADSTVEGLRYEITKVGDGTFPTGGDVVVVNYTGKLLNGTVFDSNTSGGFSFSLGQGRVIKGWDIGIGRVSCVTWGYKIRISSLKTSNRTVFEMKE